MKLGGPAAPCAAVMGQWGHLVAACLASFPRGADNSRERDLFTEKVRAPGCVRGGLGP